MARASTHRDWQTDRSGVVHRVAPSIRKEWPFKVDVSIMIVNQTAVSNSGAARAGAMGACGESFLNPNAGTRSAEKTKLTSTNSYASSVVWTRTLY
jgi:hypothetical protein